MAKPVRPSNPNDATGKSRTYSLTTRCDGGRRLLQTERMANLFIEVLHSYMRAGKFTVHEFVVMPNHVHVLITIPGDMSVEKAMQLIKGGFSFRANRELGFCGEVWQRGFSDVRIKDEESFVEHQNYIKNNPVKAGLVSRPGEYAYGSAYLKRRKLEEGKKAESSTEDTTRRG